MLDNKSTLLALLVCVAELTHALRPTSRPRLCYTHPCLFYGPDDAPRLRLQAQTAHKIITAEIISAVKYEGNYNYGLTAEVVIVDYIIVNVTIRYMFVISLIYGVSHYIINDFNRHQ